MPDEIDRHLDAIQAEARRQAVIGKWTSQYNPIGTNPVHQILKPLENPHLDLVEKFSKRALAARLGKPRRILRGPEDMLYEVDPLQLTDVNSVRRDSLNATRPTLREKWLLRRAYGNLIRDSRPATLLELSFSPFSGDFVSVTWLVAGNELYEDTRNDRWGARDDFAKACAKALAAVT